MNMVEKNFCDLAEMTIRKLLEPQNGKTQKLVTTSKIRNLLAMTADIYNEVINLNGDRLPPETTERINYLKVRFIYEAGREPAVKRLVETAEIVKYLDEIRGSKKRYIWFSRYMEALVAYRKFLGDRDED